MAGEREIPTFIPGDYITFEVTIEHEANLQEEDTVAYLKHYKEDQVTSAGSVVCRYVSHETHKADESKRTVFHFASDNVVGGVYPHGEYRLDSSFVRTFGDNRIFLTEVPEVSCVVLSAEPPEPPRCVDFQWGVD